MMAPVHAAGPPELGGSRADRGTRVKICGCTSAAEVALAIDSGADAVGVIFAPSPRRISPELAAAATAQVPAGVSIVAVFVDPAMADLERAWELLPRLIPQFSGAESPQLCGHLGVPYLKVFPVSADSGRNQPELSAGWQRYPEALAVFETASRQRGGSGRTFDWLAVRPLVRQRPAMISGGLNSSNVGACVRRLRPYAVDVRSGVESAGAKDPVKLRAFIDSVRRADASA